MVSTLNDLQNQIYGIYILCGVLILLLICTIGFMYRLHRKIGRGSDYIKNKNGESRKNTLEGPPDYSIFNNPRQNSPGGRGRGIGYLDTPSLFNSQNHREVPVLRAPSGDLNFSYGNNMYDQRHEEKQTNDNRMGYIRQQLERKGFELGYTKEEDLLY